MKSACHKELPQASQKKIFLSRRYGSGHDDVMAIERGDVLHATTASGSEIRMRALGSPQRGADFPVVWVCTEDEWARSEREGDEADGLPWPVSAIREPLDA